MPVMSRLERALCTSDPWAWLARRTLTPWSLQGADLRGRWLEVGAGAGAMARQVLTSYPEVHLTVTDLDPAMVAASRERLGDLGDRVDFEVADATALTHPDDTFDGALSFLMLHHAGRWEQVLHELVRVVRPGGHLVGYDLMDTIPARLLHVTDRSGTRLAGARELGRVLAELPVEIEFRRVEIFGALTRFRARVEG